MSDVWVESRGSVRGGREGWCVRTRGCVARRHKEAAERAAERLRTGLQGGLGR